MAESTGFSNYSTAAGFTSQDVLDAVKKMPVLPKPAISHLILSHESVENVPLSTQPSSVGFTEISGIPLTIEDDAESRYSIAMALWMSGHSPAFESEDGAIVCMRPLSTDAGGSVWEDDVQGTLSELAD